MRWRYPALQVVPAQAGTYTLQQIERARRMGPGSSAGTMLCVLMLFAVLSPSAGAQSITCHPPQTPRQVAQLMFGRKIGDRLAVSAAQWGRFVDREISPRFPDGLTVLDSQGEWRDTARNITIHEPGKVVEIVLPGHNGDADALAAIAQAYKKAFHQQSVGIVVREACVSF